MNLEKVDPMHKKFTSLKRKTKLVDGYHHQMGKFETLKMGHAFLKAKLMIYHQYTKKGD
jgi:hypothetical protein